MIWLLAEELWSASRKESHKAPTIILKLKRSEFKILTRNHTPDSPQTSCEALTEIALKPREPLDLAHTDAVDWWESLSAIFAKRRIPGHRQHFSSEFHQSAAAAPAGCCFIISSIPFFISFAVGSALCVPTIQA
jgi:hypothetical protein